MTIIGYVPHDGKCLPLPGISRGPILSSYSCNRGQKLFCGSKGLLKSITSHSSKRISVACNAIPDNFNYPDFSRQRKGSSRGKSKQHQEPEHSESGEEMDYVSSKNGSLLSPTSNNTRHRTTGNLGITDQEILKLFQNVQMRLRERTGKKEEKKPEVRQQGQSNRQSNAKTIDSLLNTLKNTIDTKKSSSDADCADDQPEKDDSFEDFNNLDLFSDIESEEFHEPGSPPSIHSQNGIKSDKSYDLGILPSTRPSSNFRRKSPVPRMKFRPVLSEEQINSDPSNRGQRKETGNRESEAILDDPDKSIGSSFLSLLNKSKLDTSSSDETAEETREDTSSFDETAEEITESSAAEASPDLNSLKVSELRDLAKQRGLKGYSKLKKGGLIQLLSA